MFPSSCQSFSDAASAVFPKQSRQSHWRCTGASGKIESCLQLDLAWLANKMLDLILYIRLGGFNEMLYELYLYIA